MASKNDEVHLKKLEKAFFALKFYPVAVAEKDKQEAVETIKTLYQKGDETTRQMVLYFIHEDLAGSIHLKFMRNKEFFEMKNRDADPTAVRMDVYRAMFNYNTSLEGLLEIIHLLGNIETTNNDVAKLLTMHYSHLSTVENEASRVLRNAILDALSNCNSEYALNALLSYVKYTDDERLLHRLAAALHKWQEKLGKLKFSRQDRKRMMDNLTAALSTGLGSKHYG